MDFNSYSVLINHKDEVLTFSFNSSPISIGRSKTCELQLDFEPLSREHCDLYYEDGEFYIVDLASKNGVYLNDQRIDPHVKVKVSKNDHLLLGKNVAVKLSPLGIKVVEKKADIVSKIDFTTTKTESIMLKLEHPIGEPLIKQRKKSIKKNSPEVQSNKSSPLIILILICVLIFIAYQFLGK